MPHYKRQPFIPNKPPPNLKPDEDIFFFQLTNELFRNYEDYFERVIQCNTLVWSCSLTGKSNLTYQEAVESEKNAVKTVKGFPHSLRRGLLYLTNLTKRGKILDVCEDIFSYAREHYFKGETVYGAIKDFWAPARVLNVIPPTEEDFEIYKKKQIEEGDFENNDYLKDDSWGPPPDIFRYEVQEIDPDAEVEEIFILDAIDVKREKTVLTRDKCRFLLKLSTYYNEVQRIWKVQEEAAESCGLTGTNFQDIFVGNPPLFEESLGPIMKVKKPTTNHVNVNESGKSKPKSDKAKTKNETNQSKPKPKAKQQNGKTDSKPSGIAKPKPKSKGNNNAETSQKKKSKEKKEKQLTPEQVKQIELERKIQERENLKAQKKLIADFKKLWFKPKEDLEVEDLKDLPEADPVCFKIPNELFGDFMMILEFISCYSSVLKVRDCFPSGLTFDLLERALLKNEIAGPLSDILQVLLRTIFRCQMSEDAEILQDEATATSVELGLDEISECASYADAIQQATTAATWSIMYQNTSLYKLTLDHLSLTEILRLHLLSSGARPTDKDMKWRMQQRGGYSSVDDSGLQLRMEEPQILKALTNGTIFDLNVAERIKLISCLINQILTCVLIRDTIDDSFEQFKQARINLRALQAAERRKENEDNVWRQKLKTEKRLPPADFMKTATAVKKEEKKEFPEGTTTTATETTPPPPQPNNKPELTEEQMANYLAKRDKETARRKQDYEWKVTELRDMIIKHERKLGLHPIGQDRAFRRYWLFPTVHGLFVEVLDGDAVGTCIAPTPYYPEVNLEDLKFVEENYEKLRPDKDGSDKENSTSVTPQKVSKKKSTSSENKLVKPPEIFGICSGDPETCKVHCSHSTQWYFYWDVDQLDKLLEGLSPRGVRESELRNYLKEEKSGIVNILKKCPVRKLNTEKHYPESITSGPERRPQRGVGATVAKGALDPNLNYPSSTPIETILELQLRDLILETEEKIFLGALGSLKVSDRADWRKAIEKRSYDARTSTLKWGEEGRSQELRTETLRISSVNGDGNSVVNLDTDSTTNPLVKSLACAILQLEQSVEAKFVRKPLGAEREDDKKKKSAKASEAEQTVSKAKWIQGSPLERWETSLLKCTNLPQLFVHLFTLDNSIEWTRSVLNARCRVCRRKGDSENMLLCDGCNKGHHSYCIKPPLLEIPKTDWFCSDCKPPEPEPRKRPPRKAYEDDIDDDDDLDENSEDENDSNSDRSSPGPADLDLEETELESCAECGLGGEVICCDNCPLVYHLQCLNPPKSRVPRGTWYCPECEKPGKKKSPRNNQLSKKKRKLPKKTGRRRLSTDSEEEESDLEESQSESEAQGETKDDDGEEKSNSESDERTVPTLFVKMKFNTKKSTQPIETNSDANHYIKKRRIIESDSDEEDGNGGKRKSANQAVAKISQAVKRLRSDSKENDVSDHSIDSSSSASSRSRLRRHDEIHDSDDMDMPKRTRLQRMYTKCGDSGDLDNVLLDKLIADIMKQTHAWPFLKPVTRTDAPDYHEIVKSPMDLGTIKYKLNSMVYTCNQEFFADLQQVFKNCFMYNGEGTAIRRSGEALLSYCERKCSSLGVHFSGSN